MKLVIQRVLSASVALAANTNPALASATVAAPASAEARSIGPGLLVLVGLHKTDDRSLIEQLSRKLVNIRLFEDDEQRPWRQSVKQNNLEILLVSQFTLYARTHKGTKPDFSHAMKTDDALKLFDAFAEAVSAEHSADKVKVGFFGQHMQISSVNDGPVTLTIERHTDGESDRIKN